jgi:hypothetical protein
MCFVRARNTRLAKRYMAPRLSHHNLADDGLAIFSSFTSDCTHIISVVALARDLYSASVLTLAYFLALQLMRCDPQKTAKPHQHLMPSLHQKIH